MFTTDTRKQARSSAALREHSLGDLPMFADTPQAAAAGFRALLLQREADGLRGANRVLRESLRECIERLAAGDEADVALATRARRALALGGLA